MPQDEKPKQGYGGTSERHQRNVEGDNFREFSALTPEEAEAQRPPEGGEGHEVVTIDVLGSPEPDDDSV